MGAWIMSSLMLALLMSLAATGMAEAKTTKIPTPVITGAPAFGSTLRMKNAPTGRKWTFQWMRCNAVGLICTRVAGATRSSYRVTSADGGYRIKLKVTKRLSGKRKAIAYSRATTFALAAGPRNVTPPALTGVAEVGQKLTSGIGTWAGAITTHYRYVWWRCDSGGSDCSIISGATLGPRTLTSSDDGHRLKVTVYARGDYTLETPATSALSDVVSTSDTPLNTVAPALSATAGVREFDTVTVSSGSWTSRTLVQTTPTLTYRWQTCDGAGANCTDIVGATTASHTVVTSEITHRLRAIVTATTSPGGGTAVTTTTTSVIIPALPMPTVNPSISSNTGTLFAGTELTMMLGEWKPDGTTALAGEWLRCNGSGAACVLASTNTMYPIDYTDVGATFRLRVTATHSGEITVSTTTASAVVTDWRPYPLTQPTVSAGTPTVGFSTGSNDGTWHNTQGTLTFTYNWQQCDAAGTNCFLIGGAHGASYTPNLNDIGHTLRVVVRAYNGVSPIVSATSLPSPVVAGNPAVNTTLPAITGIAMNGVTLDTDAGLWTGLPVINYSYNWLRCDNTGANCVVIAGKTRATYQVTGVDIGSTIRSRVTASNPGGVTSIDSAPTAVVVQVPAPISVSLPVIEGTPESGIFITSTDGSWMWADSTTTYTRTWIRCSDAALTTGCVTVAGSGTTYLLKNADVATLPALNYLGLTVTATNAGGSTAATSASLGPIVLPTVATNTVPPGITGIEEETQTMTTDEGTWDGSKPTVAHFQWQRCDAAGANCVDIPTGLGQTYTLMASDVGFTVRSTVYQHHPVAGDSLVAASATTDVITAATPPLATSAPVVDGDAEVTQTLTFDVGHWTGTMPQDYTFDVYHCNAAGASCTLFVHQTAGEYLVTAADIGFTIRVVSLATNSVTNPKVGPTLPPVASPMSVPTPVVVDTTLPINVSLPLVTGLPVESQSLITSDGTWTGTMPQTYEYQWQRCVVVCTDIVGETLPAHVLTAADVGATIRVGVTPSIAGVPGATAPSPTYSSQTFPILAATPPVNTGAPRLTGSEEVSQELSVDLNTWTGTPSIDYTYQWEQCNAAGAACAPILDAIDSTYTPQRADIGSTIRAQVTATNLFGTATVATPVSAVVMGPAAPINLALPSGTGLPKIAVQMLADNGTWMGTLPIWYTYQWRRCNIHGSSCADIGGAIEKAYTPVIADVGQRLRVEVTAHNVDGSTLARSLPTPVVAGPDAPVNVVLPSIEGDAEETQLLTAADGDWSGTPAIVLKRQWMRCDAAGANCVDIPGYTTESLLLRASDVGMTFRIRVTATNMVGVAVATSLPTPVVIAATPPVNTVLPGVGGGIEETEVVLGDPGTWTGTLPITYGIQWQRCKTAAPSSCASILGDMGPNHVLSHADVGRYLRIRVTAHNVKGYAPAGPADSALYGPILPGVAPNGGTPVISLPSSGSETTQLLVADPGSWNGTQPITFTFRWQRCATAAPASCVDVANRSGGSYLLSDLDLGSYMRLVVVAKNAFGISAPTPSAMAPITFGATPPVNATPPVINGTPMDVQPLTVDDGTWTGTVPMDFYRQWLRCDALGANCVDITNANDPQYVLVSTDIGHTIRTRISAFNAMGVSAPIDTAPTAVVTAAPPGNIQVPTVSGTPIEGSVLGADFGTWRGTDPITYTYQWHRCLPDMSGCVDIPGATSISYIPTAADVGSALGFTVTASNVAGVIPADSLGTVPVIPRLATDVTPPVITGLAQDGQELTADAGVWVGLPALSTTYQWRRCDAFGASCVDIAGETGMTYIATSTDIGGTIRVVVTTTNIMGGTSATSAATAVVTATGTPVNIVVPVISGSTTMGSTLTVTPGTWINGLTLPLAYQWQRCTATFTCADIVGETGTTYTITPADDGDTITVVETGTNAVGASSVSSPLVGPVSTPALPAVVTSPSISGTNYVGSTLTATPGTWSGAPTFTYQWQRCDAAGTPASCVPIPGETGITYLLAAADDGNTVSVEVTATNWTGTATDLATPTGVIATPAAPTNTGLPTVSGTFETLNDITTDDGTWTAVPIPSITYQWQRCDGAGAGCVDIAGEINATYHLVAGDAGSTFRSAVTATNAYGSATSYSATSVPVVLTVAPSIITVPIVSGTPAELQTLSTTNGTWAGTSPSFAYAWQRCDSAGTPASCADIPGATNSTYTLTIADVGSTVRSSVTASNAAGSDTQFSTTTAVVALSAPTVLTSPAVTGFELDGYTLSVTPGTWTGAPVLGHQWERCDAFGAGCVAIGGATAASYTLTPGDVGSTLRVVETATNGAGGATDTSPVSGIVATPVAPANTGIPVVSGVPASGVTLSTDDGTWNAVPTAVITYQWERCNPAGNPASCAPIAGETTNAYLVTALDVGSTLRVTVTATNVVSFASASSAITSVVAATAPPSNTVLPSVSGTPTEGQTLTAVNGTWTGTAPVFTYQWEQCDNAGTPASCTPIGGETNPTYIATTLDVGFTVRVTVTGTNIAGFDTASSAATAPIAPVAPTVIVSPSLIGTQIVGATLTADPGLWTGLPTYGYQWQRCDNMGGGCVDIPGEIGTTYVLVPADDGVTVRVNVTATNATGSLSDPSPATGVITTVTAPANTVLPSVAGTFADGQTLTALDGTWSGSPATMSYQWERCDNAGLNCIAIPGETGPTYFTTITDIGQTIVVVVTATNLAGSDFATSPATPVIVAAAPSVISSPTVGGLELVGSLLSATDGTWSGAPTFTYQWQRCDNTGANCLPIGGATSNTYTLTAPDDGATIRVTVTATNGVGSTSDTSQPTGIIATPAAPTNLTLPTLTGPITDGNLTNVAAGTWDGVPTPTLTFQWQSCTTALIASCSDIPGEVSTSYLPTAGDVGTWLNVRVTADNGIGTLPLDTGTAPVTATIAPANVTPPVVSGTPQEGSLLTAGGDTWSGTSPTISHQWELCDNTGAPASCTPIPGETSSTYLPTVTEVGLTVRVVVTATNVAGSASQPSVATSVITPAAPSLLTPPSITGQPYVGSTLTADPGTWTGSFVTTYQWQQCDSGGGNCVPIPGETGPTYLIAPADDGLTIAVDVTATNAGGANSASAPPTGAIATPAAPVNVTPPLVTGTPASLETITTDNGTWTALPAESVTIAWERCNAAGVACVTIPGETTATYLVAAGDVGSTIRSVVTASNFVASVSEPSAVTPVITATTAPGVATNPNVTGTPAETELLSTDDGTWTGSAGLVTYQWEQCDNTGANCVAIPGETGNTILLDLTTVGSTIRSAVTMTNVAGSATGYSTPTAVIALSAPTVNAPAFFTGVELVGSTLTADPGTWTGGPGFGYQWQRCDAVGGNCLDIPGEVGITYVLTGADLGVTVTVVVTATNAAGSATSTPPATQPIAAPTAPSATVAPSIPTPLVDGVSVNADPGTWDGAPVPSIATQWQQCTTALLASCSDIPGETSSSYTPVPADVGMWLNLHVVATNPLGSTPADSGPTGPVIAQSAPVNTALPTLSGVYATLETLTTSDGLWTGAPAPNITYAWEQCDAAGANCVTIPGETSSTYVLAAGDAGSTIRSLVTATNVAGAVSQESAQSPVITLTSPPSITAQPVISGTPGYNEVLTTTDGTWTGSPSSYSYQWQQCDGAGANCVDIPGETASTYTTTDTDINATIRVTVDASNVAGSGSSTSAATAVITGLVATASPVISGVESSGNTLSATTGTWAGTPVISYSYLWFSCDIFATCTSTGVTTPNYTLTGADVGNTLYVQVTATNPTGSDFDQSLETGTIT